MFFAEETAGGLYLTCDDLTSGAIDFRDACVNVIDSRWLDAARAEVAGSFRMNFNDFAGVSKVLFVVYGFATANATSDPIGVVCTEFEVGSLGSEPVTIPGDTMRSIQ
jgi:hypothetical protein